MRTTRSERSTVPLCAPIRRRQPERAVGQLGREGGRAALGRELRGVIEHSGDGGVGRLAREREVTGAVERVFNDLGKPHMNAVTLVAEIAVENRRQQRMRETDGAVLAFYDMRGERRLECVGRDPRPLQKRYRWRPKRGRERKRVACGRGKRGEPRANELVEGLRNPERLEGVDLLVENARKFQREERISARPLVHAEQRLAGKGPPEAVVQ
jgi:hypothetical protein